MKRNERRLLEEKLRYVAMEDIELDPEREQQMFEQAKAKFMQQSAEMDTSKSFDRHKIGRRVLLVSAAAVLIMVLSFGYAVFAPESVSHAKGFLRSAAIWVNNMLDLGYKIEEPTATIAPHDGEDATYATLEEAAANIPYPLVYLDDPNLMLRSVTITHTGTFVKISISYGKESEYCRIELFPIPEDVVTDLDEDSQMLIPWQCGKLALWETATSQNALTYYSNIEIYIKAPTVPYDDFLALCQTLKVFN